MGLSALAAILRLSASAQGFAYIGAGESLGVDLVEHLHGYAGTGTNLTLTIGIDPTSANAAAMVIPTLNVIDVWNGLTPTTGNLIFGASNNIPASSVDFESTLLHEVGHALGLGHPNLGTDGPAGSDNYTQSTNGANNVFDYSAGSDGVIGSSDDLRGDDVNLNYYRIGVNDPFLLPLIVDSTTYARNLALLPSGHAYSANASRDVSALLGYGATEAALQQGAYLDEAQRTLGHDDVAGILYAMSGLDGLAGTADDYSFDLVYAGLTTSANIVLDFNGAQTGFAATFIGTTLISSQHGSVTESDIYFGPSNPWFFNDVRLPEPSGAAALALLGLGLLGRRR
jgi:hypothetical protein